MIVITGATGRTGGAAAQALLATDGDVTEGSWGRDSAGAERQGPASGGASGECGIVVKNLTNSCPP